jgi:hypothetical protein
MADETTTESLQDEIGTPIAVGNINNSGWGNENRIVEPGVKSEDGEEVRKDPEPDKTTETEEEVPEPDEEVEDAPVTPSVPDPGEFTPGDYSFEVTTYNAEGQNGRTVKVNSLEQWEQLIDTDPNFGSAGALLRAQRAATHMESSIDRDEREYKAKKAQFDEAAKGEQARTEAMGNMVSEMGYLEGKGYLPKVANQYKNADWSDPEVAKQNGVKEQIALLKYMRNENNSRIRAGLKPMTSVLDAYNAFELDNSRKGTETAKKAAGEARKAAGSRVASSSPNPATTAPAGIAVGRGGSLEDLNRGSWS